MDIDEQKRIFSTNLNRYVSLSGIILTKGNVVLQIKYEKAAIKYLKALQRPQRNLILTAIEGLTHKPAEGDIKKMSGYKDDRYRLRVGKYRIIYKYEDEKDLEILDIMDIGSRGDIYK
jgi:mRNA interferase RelE/StbE